MNTNVSILASCGLALSLAVPAVAQDTDRSEWPSSFTVGTASQGGTYFAYGSGWANLVADELGLSGGDEVNGGTMQNMDMVNTGDLELGMNTLGNERERMEG